MKTWVGGGYLMCGKDKYQHRVIAEEVLGRPLKSTEIVHHIDENKQNNQKSNLLICTLTYHAILHQRLDCVKAGFDPNLYLKCSLCKTYHLKDQFAKNPAASRGLANSCRRAFNKLRKERNWKYPFDWRVRMNQQYRRAKNKGAISWIAQEGRRL